MPLINFQTDLTNLPWGRDRRDEGRSNQPYITKDIPSGLESDDLPIRSGPDFIVRGGLKMVSNTIDDVSRMTQMLFDTRSPNGLLFIAKENVLSRTSVKTQAGGLGYGGASQQQNLGGGTFTPSGGDDPSLFQNISNFISNAVGLQGGGELVLGGGGGVNQGIYLPTSTLLQTAGVGFGTHLNLLGLDPTSNGSDGLFPGAGLTGYYDLTKNQRNEEPTNQNRLNTLYNFHLDKDESNEAVNVYSYPGGPQSILGIGNTNLKFSDQGTGARNPNFSTIKSGEYLTSRPNDRTTSDFISPLTGGVSGKYEDYTNNIGSLIFVDGTPIINSSDGYSYNQNWDNSTTKSGSLEPRDDLYNSFRRPNGRTSGSFINPISGSLFNSMYGASLIYANVTNDDELKAQISESLDNSGGYTWELRNVPPSVYNSGSLTPIDSIVSGSFLRPNSRTVEQWKLPYGVSLEFEGATDQYNNQPLLSSEGGFTFTQTWDNNSTSPENLYSNNTVVYNDSQIVDKTGVREGDNAFIYPTDFRKELYTYPNSGSAPTTNPSDPLTGGTQNSSVLSLSPDYRSQNIDVRLNMGQPGRQGGNLRGNADTEGVVGKNVWNYGVKANELEALDKLTAMPMYSGVGPDANQPINDLVKFRIASIDNNTANGNAVYMHFRAFLDSFDDSYNASWNEVKYVGRGDSLYNYGGFTRGINLSFTVAAQSKAELIPMYKKLNYLASNLTPDYSQAGFMRGNIVRLTVGGYLYEQPGFITSLTYTVPQESNWEVAIGTDGDSDSSVKELPHVIKVSGFQFTPIHTFVPQKGDNPNNPNQRYIALSNVVGSRGNYADEYLTYPLNSSAKERGGFNNSNL